METFQVAGVKDASLAPDFELGDEEGVVFLRSGGFHVLFRHLPASGPEGGRRGGEGEAGPVGLGEVVDYEALKERGAGHACQKLFGKGGDFGVDGGVDPVFGADDLGEVGCGGEDGGDDLGGGAAVSKDYHLFVVEGDGVVPAGGVDYRTLEGVESGDVQGAGGVELA